jgi:hypothetical protein
VTCSRKKKIFILNFLFHLLFFFSEVLVHHFFNWLVHWFITIFTPFVVGRQEMVKQKYKNVQRKTINETENLK